MPIFRIFMMAMALLSALPAHSRPPFFRQGRIRYDLLDNHLYGTYIYPNELEPQKARPFLIRSGRGLYISVGTERSFLGFGQSKSSHLLMVDKDPFAVMFNRINIALLKMATSQEDYLELRRTEDIRLWKSHPNWTKLSESERRLLLGKICSHCKPNFSHWSIAMNYNYKFEALHKISSGKQQVIGGYLIKSFHRGNYLSDPIAFKKLSQAAKEGRMVAMQIDLSNRTAVSTLLQSLEESGLDISVLDFSNLWDTWFRDKFTFTDLVRSFDKLANPDTLLLSTVDYERRPFPRWMYVGTKFRFLRKNPKLYFNDEYMKIFRTRPDKAVGFKGRMWVGHQVSSACDDELIDEEEED